MPKGQNPWSQLLGARRRRTKGSLDDLAKALWRGVLVATAGLEDAITNADADEARRWLYVLHQVGGSYAKVLVDHEMEVRLKTLEERLINDKPLFTKNGQAREILW